MVLDNLTGNKTKTRLPEGVNDAVLSNRFLEFFDDKIEGIVRNINSNAPRTSFFPNFSNERLHKFDLIDINELEVIMARVKFTYCDYDPVPMAEIKTAANFKEYLNVILVIVNLSLKEISFPKSEKSAIIKPILKGNLDSQVLSSYRPVSNLTFLSKVIENVILNKLVKHLERVGALPDSQSAYRRLYSTETAVCSVINDLILLMDSGSCCILILLDLSAAFDTVRHDLLVEDLRTIGIVDDALEYIKNYLEGRTYKVKVGNSFSDEKPLLRGVPQGSVLGPILFCIYTIELSHLLDRHGVGFKLFADDTQFYMMLESVEDTERKLSEIMVDIKTWMDGKQLKLNEDKTECLIIGKKNDISNMRNIQNLSVNNTPMNVSKSVKNLGVLLDCSLTLKEQISKIVKISGYHLRNIAFVRKYLDECTVKKLVHNYIISRLDFCNSIYYGLPNYHMKKIQLIMNRAARLIKGVGPRERITPILIELHWLPVKARIVYKICLLVFNALKFGKPEYVRRMLKDFQPDTDMLLRHGSDLLRLQEPRCNLQLGFRAFEISAPRLFNKLPQHVKNSDTTAVFKKKLKTFLFGDSYTNDGEIDVNYKL